MREFPISLLCAHPYESPYAQIAPIAKPTGGYVPNLTIYLKLTQPLTTSETQPAPKKYKNPTPGKIANLALVVALGSGTYPPDRRIF